MEWQYRIEEIDVQEIADPKNELPGDMSPVVEEGARLWKLYLPDDPSTHMVMYVPSSDRTGIYTGGDSDWFDSTGDIEDDIRGWLTDPDWMDMRN